MLLQSVRTAMNGAIEAVEEKLRQQQEIQRKKVQTCVQQASDSPDSGLYSQSGLSEAADHTATEDPSENWKTTTLW